MRCQVVFKKLSSHVLQSPHQGKASCRATTVGRREEPIVKCLNRVVWERGCTYSRNHTFNMMAVLAHKSPLLVCDLCDP